MNLYNQQKFNGHQLIFLVLLIFECVHVSLSKILTNSYLVEFKRDIDLITADEIAFKNGFINKGSVNYKMVVHFS
jgi:hypothetical protein